MGTTARTLSEKIQFYNGETERVTLKYDTGKQVAGRFGDQYMFGLEDGRIMFVEPEVHSQIVQLGARAGDTIEITKRSEKQGRSTRTLWDVAMCEAAQDENEPPDWASQAPAPSYASQPPSWTSQGEPERTTTRTAERKPPQSQPPARAPQPAVALANSVEEWEKTRQRDYQPTPATETAWPDGQVETRIERKAVAAVASARPTEASASDRDQLLKCLISAVDAARLASRYAGEQGFAIVFGGEDVRALALSIYIGAQKAGRF